jgi:glycolate oxidase
MESLCRAREPTLVLSAESEAESARWWRIRKQVPWTLKALSTYCSIEDIVVPISRIPQIIHRIRELEGEYGLAIPVFGHAGDGNLHAHPLSNRETSEEDWYATLPRLLADLYRSAAELGGTISGEHGIGSKRREFLPLVMGDAQIDLLARIKKALDPNGILNPGKIFPSG